MRKSLAAGLIALLASGSFAAEEKKEAKVSPLDGVWDGWVMEGDGGKNDRGQIHLQLTIKDGVISGKQLAREGGGGGRGGPGGGAGGPGGGDMGTGNFTLGEPDKDGKRPLDSTRLTGGGGGGRGRGGPGGGGAGGAGGGGGGRSQSYKGLAMLEGDTLKWCVANPGNERPADLRTNRANRQFLMVLKKQKAEEPAK